MNDLLQRITIHPDVCHGKPVVRGLRYPVEMLLELMSSGMTNVEILEDYPDLEPDDLRAVLAYATRLSQIKRVHSIPA
ncbi:MAG: DUF433 domain-containing protein [Anaerolineae bacterium]|nr:DUF433 domain-containing protein [Anaerolineae bacterium]